MNPLLQNVVPPDGLTGILVKTITDLLKANQSLSEEHEKMKSMNQFLLWTNQILMEKLVMTNTVGESDGESANGPPLTITDPSQLPPQMLPLLPQVLQSVGTPITKEEIEEVSKKMDGLEEKCQKIMSILANTFGMPNLTSNQSKPAAPFVVPTVQKTRVQKVSNQRSAHKKKVNLEGLINRINNGKAETLNEPSTSSATAHAIIDTSASVEINMDQISPMLHHNVDFNGIKKTPEATDLVLKAQMSILRAMLQGPQGELNLQIVEE